MDSWLPGYIFICALVFIATVNIGIRKCFGDSWRDAFKAALYICGFVVLMTVLIGIFVAVGITIF